MGIKFRNYEIKEETWLKSLILSRGIEFSEGALEIAKKKGAKKQNLVYNMPLNAKYDRPQELLIKHIEDDYEVVVSCVAATFEKSNAVYLDVDSNNKLFATVDGEKIDNVEIDYVEEPEYYREYLSNGENIKKYISTCGLDELNIIPWKGCAISKICKFCGINNFIKEDDITAHAISRDRKNWEIREKEYLKYLKEGIEIAVKSKCYKEHVHVILISGNLDKNNLDYESEVFSKIAKEISPIISSKSNEGIIVVISPPNNFDSIEKLKKSGVSKVVFNIEAITENGLKKYCPGKYDLGREYFIERLKYAVNIFGRGNVWTNLVFGLEDKEEMLKHCTSLAEKGIVISANVLHLDKGNTLDCSVPKIYDIVDFFFKLEKINSSQNFLPFYCAKALRTSISNEMHDLRVKEVNYEN